MNSHEENVLQEQLEALDNLIRSGHIRASCPACGVLLTSIHENECTICKSRIDTGKISLKIIDWSEAS